MSVQLPGLAPLAPQEALPRASISLVLGSGGARGYAHVGVIEELLAQGYDIRSVAGSSMGALVGGIVVGCGACVAGAAVGAGTEAGAQANASNAIKSSPTIGINRFIAMYFIELSSSMRFHYFWLSLVCLCSRIMNGSPPLTQND